MNPTVIARRLVLGLAATSFACGSTPGGLPPWVLEGGPAGVDDGGMEAPNPDGKPDVGGQATATAPLLPPSAGCGKPTTQELRFATYSVHLTGATLDPSHPVPPYDRGYSVRLPPSYDPSVPTRTVFLAGGCSSSSTSTTAFGPLGGEDRRAIYVGLEPPPTSIDPERCWDNTGAASTAWEYFALVATEVERAFCVDRNRELVAGSRSGGTQANMLGCYFSKPDPNRAFGPELVLRAQLSVASGLPMALPACGGPVAALWIHDKYEANPVSDSSVSLDRVLGLNGCAGSATEDWGASTLGGAGCKKYSACPRDYPVVFCETMGRGRQSNYISVTAPALMQFSDELPDAP